MKIGKFSYYEAPAEPYLDKGGRRHYANRRPSGAFTLAELYEYITTDKEAQEHTETLRRLLSSEEGRKQVNSFYIENKQFKEGGLVDYSKAYKNRMFRTMTATGLYDPFRKQEDLQTPSNLVCVDFDHFCNDAEEVRKAKQELLQDDVCKPCLVFTSPSGDGLKCLFKFEFPGTYEGAKFVPDKKEFRARLKGLYKYLRQSHPAWIEKGKGKHALDDYKNFAQLCNISHDEEAILDEAAEVRLDFSVWREDEPEFKPSAFTASGHDEEAAQYYADELLRNAIDITSSMSWEQWLGLAYSFKGLAHGLELFQEVSSLWPDYSESNTLRAWEYAKQAPGANINSFFKKALDAGIKPWINSGSAAAQEAKRAFAAENAPKKQNKTPQSAKESAVAQDTQKQDKEQMTQAEEQTKLTAEQLVQAVLHTYGHENGLNEIMEEAGEVLPAIELKNYKFGGKPLSLKCGALTVIGAQTSHGKTRFLENICLDVCNEESEGLNLFFSLEEPFPDILAELVNIHVNKENLAGDRRTSNLEFILKNFKELKEEPSKLVKLRHDINAFCNKYLISQPEQANLLSSAIHKEAPLKVLDKEEFCNVDTLCTVCNEVAKTRKIKAIFLDHLGMMYTDKAEFKNRPKTERVEEIVTRLEALAKRLQCPIVITAQLKRTNNTCFTLENSDLADSADIERSANTVILLWNSVDTPQGVKNEAKDYKKALVYGNGLKTKEQAYEEDATPKELLERGFRYGFEGVLFARITKRRGERKNTWNVFQFNGDTGKISAMTLEAIAKFQESWRKKTPGEENVTWEDIEGTDEQMKFVNGVASGETRERPHKEEVPAEPQPEEKKKEAEPQQNEELPF